MVTAGGLRLGLTGGIGSGKSTVAQCLQSLGAVVIDADAIARACTAPGGAAMPAIAQTFGRSFVAADGAMDRQRMREHVFQHPLARAQLEAIVHPLVAHDIERQAAVSRARCTVFDVPLLVESPHWRPQLDSVLVIDCEPETQINRVMARNSWERAIVQNVLNSQIARPQRLAAADAVLYNDGIGVAQLHRLVSRLAQRFGL